MSACRSEPGELDCIFISWIFTWVKIPPLVVSLDILSYSFSPFSAPKSFIEWVFLLPAL